jgi:hypothetical protein
MYQQTTLEHRPPAGQLRLAATGCITRQATLEHIPHSAQSYRATDCNIMKNCGSCCSCRISSNTTNRLCVMQATVTALLQVAQAQQQANVPAKPVELLPHTGSAQAQQTMCQTETTLGCLTGRSSSNRLCSLWAATDCLTLGLNSNTATGLCFNRLPWDCPSCRSLKAATGYV